jgi:hypothetical protein
VTYRADNGNGPAAQVNEISDSETEFVFYPETWNRIVDGVAIVNPGPESAKVTASVVTAEGVEIRTVTLAENLKPYAEYISVLETVVPEINGALLKINASHPVDLLMLRMNQDATMLYTVSGLTQK